MNTGLTAGFPADVRSAYAAGFAQALARGAGLPSWLLGARKDAFDAFLSQGWPTTKQEDWRFTDVGPIAGLELRPAAQLATFDRNDLEKRFDPSLVNLGSGRGHRLVFVDGQYQAGFSTWEPLPGALRVMPLSAALTRDAERIHGLLGHHLPNENAFVSLNTAFMSDGAFIHIPAGFTAELPIYLVFLSSGDGTTSFPRTVVLADEGSAASMVEVHLGAAGSANLANAATEILVGPRARLSYHSVQKASPLGFQVATVAVTQKADSVFSAHSFFLDGRIVRNDLHAMLDEEGCTCTLNGLYLAGGTSHIDNHTTIDHRMPKSTSREVYKGVVDGRARAVFNGRIIVRPGAQQTDARQTNRNLLLADGAMVHTKPHLEIFANDVKCAHGATIGRLDDDALFYLRSRGIGVKEAYQLLIRAFVQEGLERVEFAPLRAELEQILANRIDTFAATGAPT
jgi:Fe-S cluster assembly protein SufD